MTPHQVDIQIIAIIVASSCAIPGVFLVLRRMSMLTDAISHSILFGIVLALFVVKELTSPLLILGAAASGVLAVSLIDAISRNKLVKEDASIGLVFPFLFSIGVILISKYAWNVHIDVHSVLLGELAFAPFDRLIISGRDIGPKSAYIMGSILVINILFVTTFYKELKLSTFDENLASTMSLKPRLLHYTLMALVSITCVGAFDAVGSILVISLIIVPPCCAYLLTGSLSIMILIGVFIGILSSILGFWFSNYYDVNIAGSMALACGFIFVLVFLFSPKNGFIYLMGKRYKQKWNFSEDMLLIHLHNHENSPDYLTESSLDHLHNHMLWSPKFASRVVNISKRNGNISIENNCLFLTEKGRNKAKGKFDN